MKYFINLDKFPIHEPQSLKYQTIVKKEKRSFRL